MTLNLSIPTKKSNYLILVKYIKIKILIFIVHN